MSGLPVGGHASTGGGEDPALRAVDLTGQTPDGAPSQARVPRQHQRPGRRSFPRPDPNRDYLRVTTLTRSGGSFPCSSRDRFAAAFSAASFGLPGCHASMRSAPAGGVVGVVLAQVWELV